MTEEFGGRLSARAADGGTAELFTWFCQRPLRSNLFAFVCLSGRLVRAREISVSSLLPSRVTAGPVTCADDATDSTGKN